MANSAFEAYRRHHHLMDIQKIVAFFLFNKAFPRSVRSCVASADWSLREIEKESGTHSSGNAQRQISSLRHRLENTNVREVIAGGMHQFIDLLQHELNSIGDLMAQDYFNAEPAA